MPRKPSGKASIDRITEMMREEEVEGSMILLLTEKGERIYLHHFGDEIAALDFLEQMTSSYRSDMIEKALKRGMN